MSFFSTAQSSAKQELGETFITDIGSIVFDFESEGYIFNFWKYLIDFTHIRFDAYGIIFWLQLNKM